MRELNDRPKHELARYGLKVTRRDGSSHTAWYHDKGTRNRLYRQYHKSPWYLSAKKLKR